jgi:hypothetical protein
VDDIDRLGDDEIEGVPVVRVTHEAFDIAGDADEARPFCLHAGGLDRRNDAQSVHLRQVKIYEHDGVMVVAQSLERLLAVLHDIDPVAALGEQELEQVLRDEVVFGHQDRQRNSRRWEPGRHLCRALNLGHGTFSFGDSHFSRSPGTL